MKYKNSFAPCHTIDPEALEMFPHLKARKETPRMGRAKKVRDGADEKLSAEQVRRHERKGRVVTRSQVDSEDYTLII